MASQSCLVSSAVQHLWGVQMRSTTLQRLSAVSYLPTAISLMLFSRL